MTGLTIHGIVPPVCTPLDQDGNVDFPSLRRLTEHLVKNGVDGLFVLGSTSEAVFLTDTQRQAIIDCVLEAVGGKVPIFAGTIDTTTPRVAEKIRAASSAGVDGVVVTAPFYARTHNNEIRNHYRILKDIAGSLPVIAYDIPVSVNGVKLDTNMVIELASENVLSGIKDSSGNDAATRDLVLRRRASGLDGFAIMSGSELTADALLLAGVDGLVPGLGNVDPAGYVRLFTFAKDGDWARARGEQERLFELFRIVDVASTERMGRGSAAIGAFKAALASLGVISSGTTASPSIQLEAAEISEVHRIVHLAGLGIEAASLPK